MIIWGSGGDEINLGEVEKKYCETCERSRTFELQLEYRYWGIYWIFNFLTKKKYWILCEICSRGVEVEKDEVEPTLDKVSIPFMARYGFFVLALIVVIAVTVTAFNENQEFS